MPKYRQTYTKIVESLDVDALPDDFSRLMWVFLPLVSCREGRGMAIDSWLKSKIFPLRTDIETNQCIRALGHMVDLDMVEVYKVDGRLYYQIVNFHTYQSGTSKEAESSFPPPPPEVDEPVETDSEPTSDLLPTNSGPTPDKVENRSASDAYADSDAYAKADTGGGKADEGSKANTEQASEDTGQAPPPDRVLLHEFRELLNRGGVSPNVAVELAGALIRDGYQPDYVRRHVAWHKSKHRPVGHLVQALRSRDEPPDIKCKTCPGELGLDGKCETCEAAIGAVLER